MLGARPRARHRGPARPRVPRPLHASAPTGSSPTCSATSDGVAEDARVGRGDLRHRRATTCATSPAAWPPSRTLVTVSWALQRTEHGEQPVWMGIALAALLGQIGLPGGGFGHGYGSMADVGAPTRAVPAADVPPGPQPGRHLHPGRADHRPAARTRAARSTTTATRCALPDIRLVYWAGGNPFHHHQDLNRLRRALRPARHGRRARAVLDGDRPPRRHRAADHDDARARRHRRAAATTATSSPCRAPSSRSARPATTTRSSPSSPKRLDVWRRVHRGPHRARLGRAHLRAVPRAGRRRATSTCPPFDEFWAAGEARLPVDVRRPHAVRPLPRRPRGRTAAARRAGASSCSPRRSTAFGYDDCPGHPAWLEPTEWLGGAARASASRCTSIANQPSTRLHSQLDAGAHSQAGEGRGPRADPHPSRRRRGARHRRRRRRARVQRPRRLPRRRGRHRRRAPAASCKLSTGAWFDPVDPADRIAVRARQPERADRRPRHVAAGAGLDRPARAWSRSSASTATRRRSAPTDRRGSPPPRGGTRRRRSDHLG